MLDVSVLLQGRMRLGDTIAPVHAQAANCNASTWLACSGYSNGSL